MSFNLRGILHSTKYTSPTVEPRAVVDIAVGPRVDAGPGRLTRVVQLTLVRFLRFFIRSPVVVVAAEDESRSVM
jgi:hypothetical protein